MPKEANYTAAQKHAIDVTRLDHDACIVAGPGSGKTSVLVERYRQLVMDCGIPPDQILAITFTEKAAANMRQRLKSEFSTRATQHLVTQMERGWVSTIHGFCTRLLKEHATAAGLDPEFQVMDEQAAELEKRRVLRETLDEFFRTKPAPMRALLAAMNADLEREIPIVYEAMRSAGVRPRGLQDIRPKLAPAPLYETFHDLVIRFWNGFPRVLSDRQTVVYERTRDWVENFASANTLEERMYAALKSPLNGQFRNDVKQEAAAFNKEPLNRLRGALLDEFFAAERALLLEILRSFDERFSAAKAAQARLDFNDLEYFAVKLLEENRETRREVGERFRQIMIDEFQDTSGQQASLVELLRRTGGFYAVGDLNQSIYGFRYASPKVFRRHQETVQNGAGHYAELEDNFRSRQEILDATRQVLDRRPGIASRALIAKRTFHEKSVAAVEAFGVESDDLDGARELECAHIADRIRQLMRAVRVTDKEGSVRAARQSDFAILVRNSDVLDSITQALDRAGLAWNLNRRRGFWETREARDLVALLRVLRNPEDEIALLTALRSRLCGISDEALAGLRARHRYFGRALAFGDRDLTGIDRERFERFRTGLTRWRESCSFTPPARIVVRALDELGCAYDPETPAGRNVEKLFHYLSGYAAGSLSDAVSHIEALRTNDPRESDLPIDETLNAVQIMTAHAAKGLEFPVVVIAAMDKGVREEKGSLNFTPEFGLGIAWQPSALDKPSSGRVHSENKNAISEAQKMEGDRLLYVAMTRAEEHLLLTWSQRTGKKPENWAKIVKEAIDAGAGIAFTQSTATPGLVQIAARNGSAREVQVLPRPSNVDPADPATTATALSRFAACPRRYYYANSLGFSRGLLRPRVLDVAEDGHSLEFDPADIDAASLGKEVHALLAGEPVQPMHPDSRNLAGNFTASPLGLRAIKASKLEREWDFLFAIEEIGLLIRGTVDLWFADDHGLTVVDYKTDDVTPEQALERAQDYSLQIEIYAAALARSRGRAVTGAWLYFLRRNLAVAVPIDESAERLQHVGRLFLAAQRNLEFPVHVGAHCRSCDFYRGLCPADLNRLTQ